MDRAPAPTTATGRGRRRYGVMTTLTVLLAGAAPSLAHVPAAALTALVALALMAASVRSWAQPPVHDAIVVTGLLWLLLMVPVTSLWPLPAAAALALAAVHARRAGHLHTWRSWWRTGRADRLTWWLVAAVVAVTAVCLVLWQRLTGAELGDAYADLATSVPVPVLVLGVFAFLVVNGAVEDSIWSGILLGAALRVMPARAAVAVVAVSFGLAHLDGVPDGPIGAVMAGSWGLLLALLRLRTGGMLATYLAHIAADATIVAVLVPSVLHR